MKIGDKVVLHVAVLGSYPAVIVDVHPNGRSVTVEAEDLRIERPFGPCPVSDPDRPIPKQWWRWVSLA